MKEVTFYHDTSEFGNNCLYFAFAILVFLTTEMRKIEDVFLPKLFIFIKNDCGKVVGIILIAPSEKITPRQSCHSHLAQNLVKIIMVFLETELTIFLF